MVEAQRLKQGELDRQRASIGDDLDVLRGEAIEAENNCRRQIKRWERTDKILGLLATVLAAVAGLAILSREELAVIGGIIALLSAGCSAAYTFLGAAKQRELQARLLQGWILLGAGARRIQLFDLPRDEWLTGQARTDLKRLSKAKAALQRGDADAVADADELLEAVPGPA